MEGERRGWAGCCGSHEQNEKPAGEKHLSDDVLALWHCLQEMPNRNACCTSIADCISGPIDPRHCSWSPYLIHLSDNYPVPIIWLWQEILAYSNYKIKSLSLSSLPLVIFVCSPICYWKVDIMVGLPFPLVHPKRAGLGAKNICVIDVQLDFWNILSSFTLPLPACQHDSWMFLCGLPLWWWGL